LLESGGTLSFSNQRKKYKNPIKMRGLATVQTPSFVAYQNLS
jgi:hypothetical protein